MTIARLFGRITAMANLYKKLYDYREKLRDRENKHTPTAVIPDEPLKALSRLKPTTLDDMLKVSGIGKSFVNKYGVGFLNVIHAELKPARLKIMCSEVKDTLKSLQARLTNVNRRNRMLYLPKISSARTIDLYTDKAAGQSNIIDALLSFNGSPVKLCDLNSSDYAAYNRLIRAATADTRETGNNMLYVGYPFAIGSCGTVNTFNVAAPLVLFPVKLENVGGKITMYTDDSRDITYNKALILCFNKFNNRSSDALPHCAIDEVKKRDFLVDTVKFYADNGIELGGADEVKAGKLEKYFAYTEKTFPKFGVNEYKLVPSAVVGLFPMYSGEMQKDFDDIISSGVMPPTLTNLLEGADEVEDFYGNSAEFEVDPPVDSEGNIDYISELNVSQEHAIERANSELALVMQGPPGTGKSQTITSMISDAVNKDKTVLIVSQKRAALSVIYSRLGRLSEYALFVDDPKDKNAFYDRLKAMFNAVDTVAPFNTVAFKRAVESVDGDINDLSELSKALLAESYGAPMIKIYAENLENRFKAAERDGSATSTEKTDIYRACVPPDLLDCGYDELKAACEYLNDKELLKTLGEFYDLTDKYDWLVDMNSDLSSATVVSLISEFEKLVDEYSHSRFKFKFKKNIKSFVESNFKNYDRALIKRLHKAPVELLNGVKAYNDYRDCKITADTLDFCTKLYFGAIANIRRETGEQYLTINSELMEYCGYAYIDMFESTRRAELSRVANYSSIVSRICSAIDKKQRMTRDKTLNVLKTAFNINIAESKRRGEMLRAIDGKRRPAVSKFVEKFEFELFRGVRVFLMTPEAVSEILPLKNDLFDLLVFDEASQIYVERGIPAIARAKRMVIAGDHKQLRPSSLGDGRVTVEEDEESEAVLEEESLLDIARFKFPEVMLSYHYRSRFEELIAFSNAAFYDGRLNISPNPTAPKNPPITVYKVNGKWEDRINVAEAQRVIELIAEHLAACADLPQASRDTLGVITFNAKQRDCILDLIDKKCDADPEFKARYLDEYTRREDGEDLGLFVKNIENVQGDERDRIIFSFAYAHNEKGQMSRNFGWLNRQGGENRLNVAISRAKKKIDIVTSIIPSDLRVDDIKSRGIHLLRSYLDYAYCISDGDGEAAKRVLASFSGDEQKAAEEKSHVVGVKESVAAALKAKGYSVDRDIGMGNYKLDLAVKNSRGEYALGIECDENVLSASSSTRERDVMRKKFMESRGWALYRVWSSDWYADPDKVVGEILSKISA